MNSIEIVLASLFALGVAVILIKPILAITWKIQDWWWEREYKRREEAEKKYAKYRNTK